METLLNVVTIGLVFIFGAAVGSFLNVVIYRLPAGLSLLRPPSHCPKCSHRLGITENVPILGWLWLRGRCRWCKTRISFRYPLVELVTGLLFYFVFWHFNQEVTLTTFGYWVFLSWLLTLSLIDLDTMTLPNALTQSGLVLGLVYQGIIGWQKGDLINVLMLGIGSAVLGVWLFDLIRWVGTLLLGQAAMGGGDPKLAAMIGAWLGWQGLLATAFLACALGSLVGLFSIVLGRLRRRQAMPFGPFLALAAALTAFWGQEMISAYLKIFFPLSSLN